MHTTVLPNPARMKNPGKIARRLAAMEQLIASPTVDAHRKANLAENAAVLRRALVNASRCTRCGRHLTDPASIDRGYGPECIKSVA